MQVVWEGATLGWQAGSSTLLAVAKEGGKAEIRLGPDRAMVSEEVLARIRKKGKIVRAKVTVAAIGGKAFKIIAVEV